MKYQNISLVRNGADIGSNVYGNDAKNITDITAKQMAAGWGTNNLPGGVPQIASNNLVGGLHLSNVDKMYGNWGDGYFNFIIAPPYVCNYENDRKCTPP